MDPVAHGMSISKTTDSVMVVVSARHARTAHHAHTDATDEVKTTAATIAGVSDAALVKSPRGFGNGYTAVSGARLHYVVGGMHTLDNLRLGATAI